MPALKIMHFSDVLCVWAHVGQANIFKLVEKFGDRVEVDGETVCQVKGMRVGLAPSESA